MKRFTIVILCAIFAGLIGYLTYFTLGRLFGESSGIKPAKASDATSESEINIVPSAGEARNVSLDNYEAAISDIAESAEDESLEHASTSQGGELTKYTDTSQKDVANKQEETGPSDDNVSNEVSNETVDENPEAFIYSEFNTIPITQYRSDNRIESLNSLQLSPTMPGNQELKAILDGIMPGILENCTTNEEKVRACYDYLIDTCDYSTTVKYDYEKDAVLLLTERHGSCTYYVATLHYMLLYLGIDNQIVNGYRYPMPNTETTSFHRWIEITIGGIPYIFDSQWEDTLMIRGGNGYQRYFLKHDELYGYYQF